MGWRDTLARLIVGKPQAPRRRGGARLYAGARNTYATGGFGGSTTSADAELNSSLTLLRSRSRQMLRDSAYARRAKAVTVNNVVGAGVGLQAQVMNVRGQLAERVNADIEAAWREWTAADSCHTGGALAFSDLERALLGEVFEGGDVLVRLHLRPFGRSAVPLALEVIEAERLADHVDAPGVQPGHELRMGVEVDAQFHRPVAYWIRSRHRGDMYPGRGAMGSETVERVPAEQVLHLRIVERWPQTRGVPWMHAVLRKLDDLNEYSQHEITAARASAAYFASLKNPADEPDGVADQLRTETDATGQSIMQIDALQVLDLPPGTELDFHAPNRPNSAFAEFTRAMLREIAAGCGASYESISRDYSQSNYSSSRLALLDDRDNWRALQQWWVRSFRQPLHRIWLRQAVLARAIASVPVEAYAVDPARYEAALFKCRGWSWVDPAKEVAAFKEAERAGYITKSQVIAQTAGGMDIEDYIAERRRELDMLEAADIETDTVGAEEPAAAPGTPAAPAEDDDPADSEGGTTDGAPPPARAVVTLKARAA